MSQEFKLGDHVGWNREAGPVRGPIVAVHPADFPWEGRTHHASPAAPRYGIKSDKRSHVAVRKGTALHRIDD